MKTLYVGNLALTATESKVREMFADHGDIESLTMVTDQVTGRPRGFAFIEMSSDGATAAIAALNGLELDGKTLRVSEARPRPVHNG